MENGFALREERSTGAKARVVATAGTGAPVSRSRIPNNSSPLYGGRERLET